MSLPNFIIAGFPKCGSTALHYFLEGHPEIYMPKQKELHFFTAQILMDLNQGPNDREVKRTQTKSFQDYQRRYSQAKNEKAIGDASPSYINYPEIFSNIKQTLNSPKIIILVRDPIKRAYSNYLHLVREQRERLEFGEALKMEEERRRLKFSDFWYYTFNSMYSSKIKRAKEIFDEVLIVTQEELNSSTIDTLRKIFKFLEVDHTFTPSNLHRRYNPGGSYKENTITRFIFKKNRLNTFIRVVIPIPAWAKHIKHRVLNRFQMATPPIKKESEDYLVNVFKYDVEELSRMGVDTSRWNKRFFCEK